MPLTSSNPGISSQTQGASSDLATPRAQLQQRLLRATSSDSSRAAAVASSLRVLREAIRPAAVLYYRRHSDTRDLVPARELSPSGTGNVEGEFQKALARCCEAAVRASGVRTQPLNGQLTAVAVPVLFRSQPAEAIGVIGATGSSDLETTVALVQVVASHITLWEAIWRSHQLEIESTNSAALIELLAKCHAAPDLKHACVVLANELKDFLGCKTVAMGLSGSKNDCRLTAVSGMSKFDPHSEFSTSVEAAMDEAIVKDLVTILPANGDRDRTGTLAHQRAMALVDSSDVVSSPLKDEQGSVIGAWMFFADANHRAQAARVRAFIRSAHVPIGSNLGLLSKATESPIKRQFRSFSRRVLSLRTGVVLMAMVVFCGLMLLPVPYKINCLCQVQPVVRRFVAAPYDGKLERTFVERGDRVNQGDLLARLDGMELRWELAGLEAEYNRAEKSRDAAMAVDSIGEAQQAACEQERLMLKIQLIRNRLDNLEIRSPLAGIVISGDLRKAVGAPLSIGQTMFEIAPLERMVLEVEIPEREILHVQTGQQVVFRLDANPFEKWGGPIRTVFPKAELRNDASVYVAEVDVDNRSAELRPGMKAHAKVMAGHHPLGWNLFHRPCESICLLVGW